MDRAISWETIAAQTVILTFVFGVLAYFLRPLYDKHFMATFDRNQDEIRARVLKMVESQITQASLKLQEALDRQARALEEIAASTSETASAVSYIQGQLDIPWDGRTERRRSK